MRSLGFCTCLQIMSWDDVQAILLWDFWIVTKAMITASHPYLPRLQKPLAHARAGR